MQQRAEQRRARREQVALTVAESEARHRTLITALPEGVLLLDADGSMVAANPAASGLLGVLDGLAGLAGLDGRNDAHCSRPSPATAPLPVIPPQPGAQRQSPEQPDGAGRAEALLAPALTALRTGEVQRQLTPMVHVDGPHSAPRRSWIAVTAVPVLDPAGRAQAVVSSLIDVTEQHQLERALRRGADTFGLAMAHSPIGIALADLDGCLLRVNRRLCSMLGYRADELCGRRLADLIHPDERPGTRSRIAALLSGEVDAVELERRWVGHGGMQLWGTLAVAVTRDPDGCPEQLIVQVADSSETRKAQDLLTHMALHDPLTGLPNRAMVVERVQQALDRTRHSGRRVALLLCDVDSFRVVNDGAGHEQGDAVLVELARRVARGRRAGDFAGRLDGDEFVMVCDDVADETEAVALAERLQAQVAGPLEVGRRTLHPSLSVGIALGGPTTLDPLSLLRDAAIAAARAKAGGPSGRRVVDAAARRQATARLEVEHSLRSALGRGELRLHFQPIVDVRTLGAVGREALLRWEHPQRGLLGPAEFLQVAEDAGLIGEIGRWVLHEAARAAARAGEGSGYVSVNVSGHQLTRIGLTQTVQRALAESGLPAQRLIIELTESVMLSASSAALTELAQLDGLGVRVVVDDFGTGFSALSYLRDLPISGIKVDRSFTAGLGDDHQCDRIVEALTGLGRGLGVDVIVEGVETEQQRRLLHSMGAEHAQGYLFGRPGPAFTPV